MGIRHRWKTVLVLISAIASAFTAGTFGSQLVISAVQSIAGTNVPVPPSELQILEANWALDPETGLVTGVDMLVTTSSSTWQLKSYQLSVQVQCSGQTGTTSPLFICSSGKTDAILPTQGIGIRPLRINLAKPVNPAIATLQNLNFVVTDLARVPPMPPKIFVGPVAPSVHVSQGSMARIPFTVTGVSGVQPGTKVVVQLLGNPKGVRATQSQVLTLVPSSTQQGPLRASSFFDIIADVDTFIGDTFIGIQAQTVLPQGRPPQDDFALIGEKIDPLPAPEPSRPNLYIANLTYPGLDAIEVSVGNNGTVAAGPFDIKVTVVIGVDSCAPGNPRCAGLPVGDFEIVEVIDVSSELGLAAGAQVTRSVSDETMDASCFRADVTHCNFTVHADYGNAVAETSEGDNSRAGYLDAVENQTPTIEAITDKAIGEGETLTVTPEASDADLPPQVLSYSLSGTAVAAGATIDPSTGIVTWVPDELDGSDTYSATVRVTDSFDAFSEASFEITVNEVNQAPTILPIADKVIDEGQMLRIVVAAGDADFPRAFLIYSLSGTAAAAGAGAFIDLFGVISWVPDEADGPGVYTATVRVSDGLAAAETSFTITVNEMNRAPMAGLYLAGTVDQGQTLVALPFLPASDTDLPLQTLTYSLSGTAFDAGATVDPSTGVVTWVTDAADAPGNYTATVRVTDSYGAFVDTFFLITVNEA